MFREALEVFISYAHEDESLRAELEQHLALLARDGEIRPWHDREIAGGDEWRGQIDERLEAADLDALHSGAHRGARFYGLTRFILTVHPRAPFGRSPGPDLAARGRPVPRDDRGRHPHRGRSRRVAGRLPGAQDAEESSLQPRHHVISRGPGPPRPCRLVRRFPGADHGRGQQQIYARAGIRSYWIANLRTGRLEVHGEPSGPADEPGYRSRRELGPGETVDLELDGEAVGRLSVRDLLP